MKNKNIKKYINIFMLNISLFDNKSNFFIQNALTYYPKYQILDDLKQF